MSHTAEAGRPRLLGAAPWLTREPTLLLVAIAVVTAIAYFNGIANLFMRWGEQQELSHGYFLPLITAWMIWARREALAKSLSRPALSGFAGVAIAMALLIVSELTVTSLMILQHLSLILLLASLALALGGRGALRMALLPIAFLLFMVPPPYWVITVLSWNFQFWSSQLGVWMVELAGIPVFLSGNVIDLGDYQLQVAEACSGLRYLFPFLSLGFLAAYLYQAPLWQRAIVFLSTIPITIFMNSVRIAITSILVQAYGTSHAEGFLHLFEGWVVFLFCMALLFGVIAVMARLSGRKDFGGLMSLPELAPRIIGGEWTRAAFRRHALAALGVLGVFAVIAHTVSDDTLRVPQRMQLPALLGEFADWRHQIREVDKETLEVLGADDYIIADMVDPEGESFNLYIAYLNMQRHGHSWHSPRQCIPGGGWKILTHDVLPRRTAEGQQAYFNRIVIENRGRRQLVYYWYDQRGRKIANEFVMKGALLVDAMRIRRTDGAMIRVITQIRPDEPTEAADARLSGFVSLLEPKLPPYIPGPDAQLLDR